MGFTDFFLDHVPGYDKFRSVAMILVIAEFTIPLLAVLALNELINKLPSDKKDKPEQSVNPKTLYYVMGAVLAIVLMR